MDIKIAHSCVTDVSDSTSQTSYSTQSLLCAVTFLSITTIYVYVYRKGTKTCLLP